MRYYTLSFFTSLYSWEYALVSFSDDAEGSFILFFAGRMAWEHSYGRIRMLDSFAQYHGLLIHLALSGLSGTKKSYEKSMTWFLQATGRYVSILGKQNTKGNWRKAVGLLIKAFELLWVSLAQSLLLLLLLACVNWQQEQNYLRFSSSHTAGRPG